MNQVAMQGCVERQGGYIATFDCTVFKEVYC